MPEILTDAYLLFTFVFKQALIIFAFAKPTMHPRRESRQGKNKKIRYILVTQGKWVNVTD